MNNFLVTFFYCILLILSQYCFSDPIYIPVSPGELIDKITILEIKSENITDPVKLNNVLLELQLLNAIYHSIDKLHCSKMSILRQKMKVINQVLWAIEDLIREEEYTAKRVQSNGKEIAFFGKKFVFLARLVYFVNDQRVATKGVINYLFGSDLVEEKQYTSYMTS